MNEGGPPPDDEGTRSARPPLPPRPRARAARCLPRLPPARELTSRRWPLGYFELDDTSVSALREVLKEVRADRVTSREGNTRSSRTPSTDHLPRVRK